MTAAHTVHIDWSYTGTTDLSCGTGATRAEKTLGYLAGVVGLAPYVYFFCMQIYPWTMGQYILAGLLAFDVAGGLVCNCLNSCKRFYWTPLKVNESTPMVRFLKQPRLFTLIHIHPLVVQYCFGSTSAWFHGLFWYVALQLSASVVLRTALYLKRPTAMFCCLCSLVVNSHVIGAIDGFEWFIPALFVKIIYGHLVREEPYRPVVEPQHQHS